MKKATDAISPITPSPSGVSVPGGQYVDDRPIYAGGGIEVYDADEPARPAADAAEIIEGRVRDISPIAPIGEQKQRWTDREDTRQPQTDLEALTRAVYQAINDHMICYKERDKTSIISMQQATQFVWSRDSDRHFRILAAHVAIENIALRATHYQDGQPTYAEQIATQLGIIVNNADAHYPGETERNTDIAEWSNAIVDAARQANQAKPQVTSRPAPRGAVR